MKSLIWSLARSYSELQFEERLEKIHAYDTAVYDNVMKSKPKSWCRVFYKVGNYCEDVENNSKESFNKTVNKAREKLIMATLEIVKRLAIIRIAKMSAISHSHKGLCIPYVSRFLAIEHKKASQCKVSNNTNRMFEVMLDGDSHIVCLRNLTCTCKKFQMCGIPCEHAYGVILEKKLTHEDYVFQWFRTAMWNLNYTDGLVPHIGARYWPSTDDLNVHHAPDFAQPGRKKVTKADKKRKRDVNDNALWDLWFS